MTPVFLKLHPDDGGVEIVDMLDISRIGPAHGDAQGCRAVFKSDGRVVNYSDDITLVCKAMEDAGTLRHPSD